MNISIHLTGFDITACTSSVPDQPVTN